jgi:hypothetical protein
MMHAISNTLSSRIHLAHHFSNFSRIANSSLIFQCVIGNMGHHSIALDLATTSIAQNL